MKTLIFDIESVGEDWEAMDGKTQEAATRWIREQYDDEEEYGRELEKLKSKLGCSPFHGEIVTIGVLDADGDHGGVYYQNKETSSEIITEKGIKIEPMTEKQMIEKFWDIARRYEAVVGFSSRTFDAPYLNIRSAVHGIRPSVDLMDARYLYQQKGVKHIDLSDQLRYYGSAQFKGSLHVWTRVFGIKSPKDDMGGDEVNQYFADGKYLEIAKYNLQDLFSTRELFLKWRELLNFQRL